MGVLKVEQDAHSFDANWTEFKQHYGPGPGPVSEIWDTLCLVDLGVATVGGHSNINLTLCNNEKGEKGMIFLLMALHFLFMKPKNRVNLARRFNICDKYASGKMLWKWVK